MTDTLYTEIITEKCNDWYIVCRNCNTETQWLRQCNKYKGRGPQGCLCGLPMAFHMSLASLLTLFLPRFQALLCVFTIEGHSCRAYSSDACCLDVLTCRVFLLFLNRVLLASRRLPSALHLGRSSCRVGHSSSSIPRRGVTIHARVSHNELPHFGSGLYLNSQSASLYTYPCANRWEIQQWGSSPGYP